MRVFRAIRCKEADLWAAALRSGAGEAADQIRLQEHLEECAGCRARRGQLSALVATLRGGSSEPSNAQLQRIWRRVEAGRAEGYTAQPWPWWARLRRLRSPWVLAGAASILLLLGTGTWLLGQRGGLSRQRRTETIARALRLAAPGWQLLASEGARLAEGGRALVVASGGFALLRSARELVVVRPGTQLELIAPRRLRLHNGILVISSWQGSAPEVQVLAGTCALTPIGTSFEVHYADERLRLAVLEGRVRVVDAEKSVTLVAGQALDRGERVPLNPRLGLRLAAELALLRSTLGLPELPPSMAAQPAALQGAGAQASARVLGPGRRDARGPSRVPTGTGKSEPKNAKNAASGPSPSSAAERRSVQDFRRPELGRKRTPQPTARPEPRPLVRAGKADLRRVEMLLARGQTAAARRLAAALLAGRPAPPLAAMLATLVAESHLVERNFSSALAAYLAVEKQYPQTMLAADSLYMAGSLELEQLNRANRATGRFQRYLKHYPQGRQREGAYVMLARAARRAGAKATLSWAVQAYLTTYPRGQYASFMQQQRGAR